MRHLSYGYHHVNWRHVLDWFPLASIALLTYASAFLLAMSRFTTIPVSDDVSRTSLAVVIVGSLHTFIVTLYAMMRLYDYLASRLDRTT